jgi:hypothetical protein
MATSGYGKGAPSSKRGIGVQVVILTRIMTKGDMKTSRLKHCGGEYSTYSTSPSIDKSKSISQT